MAGAGLSEAWTAAFLSPSDLEGAGLAPEGVRVANPLDHAEPLLRPSMLPGLLEAVAGNVRHQRPDVRLFEVGRVFGPPDPGADLPVERERLSAILAGSDAIAAKQTWDVLAGSFAFDGIVLEAAPAAGLHPTRSARVLADGREIGQVGEVDPDVLAAYEIEGRAGWLDLDLEHLLTEVPRREPVSRPVSRFPASDIDLAFVVDDDVPAAAVEAKLREGGGELLVDIRLFDVFRGPQLGPGRRSLAYRLRFNALDRTLTDEEVGDIRRRAIEAVESSLPAQLRG